MKILHVFLDADLRNGHKGFDAILNTTSFNKKSAIVIRNALGLALSGGKTTTERRVSL